MLVLHEFLPYRLNCLASEMSMRTRAEYRRTYDMTMPEWRVLATLGEADLQTAKAIGSQTYLHKTKVSRAVRLLETRRWIDRAINDADRREEFLSLSTAGRTAYVAITSRLMKFQNALMAQLGADRDDTLAALRRLEAVVGIDHEGARRRRLESHDQASAPSVGRGARRPAA